MIKDLKNETTSFIEALEDSIKDEKQLQYIKQKTAHLFESFADELENCLQPLAELLKGF